MSLNTRSNGPLIGGTTSSAEPVTIRTRFETPVRSKLRRAIFAVSGSHSTVTSSPSGGGARASHAPGDPIAGPGPAARGGRPREPRPRVPDRGAELEDPAGPHGAREDVEERPLRMAHDRPVLVVALLLDRLEGLAPAVRELVDGLVERIVHDAGHRNPALTGTRRGPGGPRCRRGPPPSASAARMRL